MKNQLHLLPVKKSAHIFFRFFLPPANEGGVGVGVGVNLIIGVAKVFAFHFVTLGYRTFCYVHFLLLLGTLMNFNCYGRETAIIT